MKLLIKDTTKEEREHIIRVFISRKYQDQFFYL